MKDEMNMMLKQLEEQIWRQKLWQQEDMLFVACSGGMDSVVLVHVLVELGYKPVLLHCNYHLRGEESNRDEDFVKALAQQLNIEVRVKSFDTLASMQEMGKGLQETARILRYQWFDEVLNAHSGGNAYLITAHHRDDQVEGLMMNFFRGTGIAGMKGMVVKRDRIIRPLLDFTRDEIAAYAKSNAISWVDDSSNAESKYTRNFFRNELIPQVRNVYPSFQDNLIGQAKRFAEIEIIYRKEIERLKRRLLISSTNGWKVPVNLIKTAQPLETILYEVFSPFGFTSMQTAEIRKLFDAETGRFMLSTSHRVLKNREWLLIEPLGSVQEEFILINEGDEFVSFGQQTMKVSHATHMVADNEKSHAYIDANELAYPLILRKWKNGDYFYPLGMKKKKKLSKFMTDIKLSRSEKENQWVIESNKKIIWIVGQRIDERFKITPQTHRAVVFKLT